MQSGEAMSTDPPENRIRIVTFMTDGLVGNDFGVINMVKKLRGTSRWFSFGTGNSVNRFLLDNMARVGRRRSGLHPAENSGGRSCKEVLREDRDTGFNRHQTDF